MTVSDDLATLRQSVRFSNAQPRLSASWECNAALDRVEAEIARLEREKGDLRAAYLAVSAKNEAAEAQAARLRDGLREIADSTHDSRSVIRQRARALLADDGAAQPKPRSEHGGYMGGEPWGGAA